MTAVFVGPIRITISAERALAPWVRSFAHYCVRDQRFSTVSAWSLTISHSASKPSEISDADFRFERHDLCFLANRGQRTAMLVTKGEEADFLAALELCLCLACHEIGGLAIHGAAAVVNHNGWLMPGPSGTGKSTAARLAGFERVVGDERVLLLPNASGHWQLISTPFWSRGRFVVPTACAHKLNGILILRKQKELYLSELGQVEALESLVRNIVYYGTDPVERQDLIERGLQVVSTSACYRLGFHKDGPWAWTLDQMHSTFSRTPCEPNTFPSISIGI